MWPTRRGDTSGYYESRPLRPPEGVPTTPAGDSRKYLEHVADIRAKGMRVLGFAAEGEAVFDRTYAFAELEALDFRIVLR